MDNTGLSLRDLLRKTASDRRNHALSHREHNPTHDWHDQVLEYGAAVLADVEVSGPCLEGERACAARLGKRCVDEDGTGEIYVRIEPAWYVNGR